MIYILKYSKAEGLRQSDRLDRELLTLRPGEYLWVDLEAPTPEEAEILQSAFKFHSLAIEDTLIEIQHPKIDTYSDHIFLVCHGINYLAASKRFETAEIDVFLGSNFLVTHHDHRMRSVRLMRDRILGDPLVFEQGLDFILHAILDRMVDNYFPELEKLEDRIEEVEEEIFLRPSRGTLSRIFQLRREILHLKRIVFPQRDVFNRLSRDEIPYIRSSCRLYFRDTYDSLFRMTDTADSYRDLLAGLLDAYLSSVSNATNDVMKLLTMISTIFIPATFVAGVYGMNFEYMPGLGSPYGFWATAVVMGAIAGGFLWLFKRKKWL